MLSLLLSFLLLLSVIVALPISAEEESTATETASVTTLPASADLYVQNKSGVTATNGEDLRVKSDNQTDGTGRRTYLLFDTSKEELAQLAVKSAKIRLFCIYADESEASYRTKYKLYATSSESGWSDDNASQYTFDTPPVTGDTKILNIDASVYPVSSASSGNWIEIDVTEYVKANFHKQITFSLRNEGDKSNKNHLTFNSSEAASNQPQLVIETIPKNDSLKPTYDLYVEYSTDKGFYEDILFVKSENENEKGTSAARRSYLMFDTSASTISDVSDISDIRLRLYCTWAATSTTEKANRKQYRLYAFTDYTWEDQKTITWSTQPESSTMELVQFIDASSYTSNTWIKIDVTEYVKSHWGEKITFSLQNHGPFSNENHLKFSSLEATNGNIPTLSICAASHASKNGTPVFLYTENDTKLTVYKCDCGGQWAYDQNDVLYRGEEVYKVCEKYTLWTATDGSYRTYKTDVEALAEHTFSSSGLCSACQEFEYVNYSFINSPATPTCTKVSGLSAPAYDADTGWLSAPEGGELHMYTGLATKSESNITPTPFEISFDVSISAILEGSSSPKTHFPLLRYRGKSGGTNKTTTLLSIGATGTAAADAIETSESIYLVLGEDYNFADGEADAIFYLTKDEWYNIQVAVDPVARSYRVYVNGEFVGAVKLVSASNMYSAGLDEDAHFRFGFRDGVANYQYNMGYNLDNITVTKTDSEHIHDLAPTNELIKINYETVSLTQSSFGYNEWSIIAFGSHTGLCATSTVTDGTNTYGFFSGTKDLGCRISLTSVVGEKDVSPLANGKYEIKMEFAIPDTDVTGGTDENDNSIGDGVPDATANTGSILRITKYNAEILSSIVDFAADGQYMSFGKLLYENDGVTPLTAVRKFDEDNVPTDTSVLQVIVDEDKGTYSVYVDNKPAYYKTSDGLTAVIDQRMGINLPSGITSLDEYVAGETTYGDLTEEMISGAGLKKNNLQSIRAFVNLLSFAVKEITVTAIPDEKVTLVGVQQRTADATEGESQAFDLRFVFGIDDLFVSAVSFEVDAYKGETLIGTQTVSSTAAYYAIQADEETIRAYECVEGEYFVAFKIVGIDEIDTAYTYSFLVTPTVLDANGTEVQQSIVYRVSCDGKGGNITVEVEETVSAE